MNDSLIVSPTDAGYHCNGECWEDNGKSSGLLAFLESISLEVRDWFVQADWATEENLMTHILPSVSEIHPIQDYINESTVDDYISNGIDSKVEEQEAWESYPTLFKWSGKYFIFNGTHRLTAHYCVSDKTFYGWIIDLDNLNA